MTALLNLVRAASWVVALFGVSLVACWTWFPDLLDRYDEEAVRDYRGQYDRARQEIRELASTSPDVASDGALGKAMELVEKVEHYSKGDVHFPTRRSIVREAARLSVRAGLVDQAVQLIDDHLALDPRDIPLALEAAAALEASDPSAALERRRALFARWPSVPMIAQPFLEQLSRDGFHGELIQATERFLEFVHQPADAMQGVMKSWRLFWSESPDFTAERSYLWETKLKGTRFELQAGLPAGQTHVRLHAPRLTSLELRDVTLSLHPKGETIPVPWEAVEDWVGIDVHDLGWSLKPETDARFRFQVPEALAGRGAVVLLAGEVTAPPRWLGDLLARGVAQELAPRYLARGDKRRLEFVLSALTDHQLLHPIR